jgi:hypothetical protein
VLHLVGILFPHNIEDARSKPHQSDSINSRKTDELGKFLEETLKHYEAWENIKKNISFSG